MAIKREDYTFLFVKRRSQSFFEQMSKYKNMLLCQLQ